jgi:uncharacterized membrane protein
VSGSGAGGRSGQGARAAATGIETLVARILVAGTYVAVGLILVGVLLMLASGIDPLTPGAFPPFDLASIPSEIQAGNPTGFIWAGIVLVMALPIGRVVVSGAGFYAAGARRLALVSVLVVLVVTLSIIAAQQIAA